MTGSVVLRWGARQSDSLLTAAALPIIISTAGVNASSEWELALALLTWLPLTVRMRWPLPVFAVAVSLETVLLAVAAQGHPGAQPVSAATMLALYTVSARYPARLSWLLAAVTALVQFSVMAVSTKHVGSDLLYLNWAVVATALGHLVRERRDRIAAAEQRAEAAERSKQAEAERQVTAERMRIAHDLHDVLAHHVALVNAQAGVAQYLLRSDPDAAEKALTGITTNSRAALDELRTTLGLLRTDPGDTSAAGVRAPTQTAEQLDALLEGFTDAGMQLTVDTQGQTRPLPGSADLAMYRIVQEALTNASKHAPGSDVRLVIVWSDDRVTLTVANTAAAPATPPTLIHAGTGHGVLGMRERACTAGGSFDAGPASHGGYLVTASLPTDPHQADRASRLGSS